LFPFGYKMGIFSHVILKVENKKGIQTVFFAKE